jgi:SAM-dependent methyltransferase
MDTSSERLVYDDTELPRLAVERRVGGFESQTLTPQLAFLRRVVPLEGAKALVIGCGPRPVAVRELAAAGLDVIGLEPVRAYAESARTFVDGAARIVDGAAEAIPIDSGALDLVYCNSVLEHVDSPRRSLEEMARVLRPGGAAFVVTTNRWRISPTGDNGEYRVPFFNWFPEVVKESYVHRHLHVDPSLANFSERPAVHWFTFDDTMRKKPLPKRALFEAARRSAWVRGALLAGTALGGMIVMVRR